jgi:serine/threonine protein kinase
MGASSPIGTIQTIGNYTLIEKIGEGYLGCIYRGFDRQRDQPVAIRILCDGIKWDENIREAYNSQCEAVAGLQHPGIASVFDFGQEGQIHYIVLESLGNSNLKNLIAQSASVTVEAKLSVMIQVAESLSHAHKKGILHRDLGPSKIHLTADGTIKVRDFALAGVLMKHLPHPWIRWGVPIYLSPEQIQQKECDQRSDIFSTGTIFYEWITSVHPFHDRDSNKALDNILQDTPVASFDVFPDAPPGIWPVLKTCLARDPQDRYQSMDEFTCACRDLLKDLAEDSRLMLSELYAALSPLRTASAKPEAPANAIALLQDIQKLLRGEKEADYISLDRLMTGLIELYPTIKASSGSQPAVAAKRPAPNPGKIDTGTAEDPGKNALHSLVEKLDASPAEPVVKTALRSDTPAASARDGEDNNNGHFGEPLEDSWSLSSETRSPFETCFIKAEDESISAQRFHPVEAQAREVSRGLEASHGSPPSAEHPGETQAPPDKNPGLEYRMKYPESQCTDAAAMLPETPAHPQFSSVTQETGNAPVNHGAEEMTASKIPFLHDSSIAIKVADKNKPGPATCYRKIRRPSYRTLVVLLCLLLMAAAAYIVWGKSVTAFMSGALKKRATEMGIVASAFARLHTQKSQDEPAASGSKILNATADFPMPAPIAVDLKQNPPSENDGNASGSPPQALLSRISGLISSGKLQTAKAELNKLRQTYPTATQIVALRKQWESKNAAIALERTRRKQEQVNTAQQQKEERWNQQLSALLERGQYVEANKTLDLWLAENPESPGAQGFVSRINEIQRNLHNYASAIAGNRYSEALNALNNAERLNPADSNFAELRRQTEARRAAAKASLSVHRLGARAAILLDGKPAGNDGEIENASIPIGNHMIAIENRGTLIATMRQEFFEGQQIALVYDMAGQSLRPMVEADRQLVAQRKTMEEVRYFDVEHEHGLFRGSCHGLLMIDYLDVAYRPTAGYHGFRLPFRLLKLNVKGKSIELINTSDNQHFQSFKFRDEQAAEIFKRSWDELKAFAQR